MSGVVVLIRHSYLTAPYAPDRDSTVLGVLPLAPAPSECGASFGVRQERNHLGSSRWFDPCPRRRDPDQRRPEPTPYRSHYGLAIVLIF
jgi:hypothetical protein